MIPKWIAIAVVFALLLTAFFLRTSSVPFMSFGFDLEITSRALGFELKSPFRLNNRLTSTTASLQLAGLDVTVESEGPLYDLLKDRTLEQLSIGPPIPLAASSNPSLSGARKDVLSNPAQAEIDALVIQPSSEVWIETDRQGRLVLQICGQLNGQAQISGDVVFRDLVTDPALDSTEASTESVIAFSRPERMVFSASERTSEDCESIDVKRRRSLIALSGLQPSSVNLGSIRIEAPDFYRSERRAEDEVWTSSVLHGSLTLNRLRQNFRIVNGEVPRLDIKNARIRSLVFDGESGTINVAMDGTASSAIIDRSSVEGGWSDGDIVLTPTVLELLIAYPLFSTIAGSVVGLSFAAILATIASYIAARSDTEEPDNATLLALLSSRLDSASDSEVSKGTDAVTDAPDPGGGSALPGETLTEQIELQQDSIGSGQLPNDPHSTAGDGVDTYTASSAGSDAVKQASTSANPPGKTK